MGSKACRVTTSLLTNNTVHTIDVFHRQRQLQWLLISILINTNCKRSIWLCIELFHWFFVSILHESIFFLIYESKQCDRSLFLTLIRCFCFINSAYRNSSKNSFFTRNSIWMSCLWIKWIILPVQKNWKSMFIRCCSLS